MTNNLKFEPVPPIANPETEKFCVDMAEKLKKNVMRYSKGSVAYTREYISWLHDVHNQQPPNLTRWEVQAVFERIKTLAGIGVKS